MSELMSPTAAGQVIGDRYTLVQQLGCGGMGQVWRATDTRLARDVAVKLVHGGDDDLRRRFEREARTAATLNHPGIVAIHDAGITADGVPYLVMELAEGETLADLIAQGPLSIADTAAIGRQLCEALLAAHAAGIVHRDIKPGNILVGPDGRVKVCDFGIAAGIHDEDTLTEAGTALGTAQYMAPEQAQGKAADHRTDLYALGCVIYAMLTGHPPFDGGSTPAHIAWQHINQPITPLRARRPGTPAALDAVVGQLLAKDTADRPQSAAEVEDRLRDIDPPPETQPLWSGRPPVGTPAPTRSFTQRTDSMPAPAASARRRRFVLVTTAAVVVLVLFGLVFTALNDRSDPSDSGANGGNPAPPAQSAQAAQPTVSVLPLSGPTAALTALEDAIRANTGQMNDDAAKDLTEKVRDIREALDEGKPGKAADKLADLRKKLSELQREGKLTPAGRNALQPALDDLAAALPATGDDD